MRILDIDYGQKRIGLAISDETATGATPAGHIEAKSLSNALAAIEKVIAEKDAKKIVIGLPRNMDGSIGEKAQETQAFAEKLKARVNVPIVTWDERLTTRAAERV